jgi:hypothetical protein
MCDSRQNDIVVVTSDGFELLFTGKVLNDFEVRIYPFDATAHDYIRKY